jgi:hypothetical protein
MAALAARDAFRSFDKAMPGRAIMGACAGDGGGQFHEQGRSVDVNAASEMRTTDSQASSPTVVPGQGLAVLAESLYLANLLVAPGLAFAMLGWLWMKHRRSAPPLARNHLRQATWASVAAGVLIACLSGAIVALGGWQWHWTWVVVLTYFVCVHGTLVTMGMFALAKAMAGQAWRYPLVGPRDADVLGRGSEPAVKRKTQEG